MIDLVILLELLININRSVIILCADYDFLLIPELMHQAIQS